jgi:UDP-N-acetylglucosamine--N-acetylmuramyl-(pentapeptide) pyrophosphoryl-undecaprenol N-acetylglucosamine transferase
LPARPAQAAGGGRQPGRQALNDIVPQALALMPAEQRPRAAPERRQADRRAAANYAAAGVQAELTPSSTTRPPFADADLIVCRAGASTVTEIAAVGAAAVFVPFPLRWMTTRPPMPASWWMQGGGWLMPQRR